jgi:hypothetical protein
MQALLSYRIYRTETEDIQGALQLNEEGRRHACFYV